MASLKIIQDLGDDKTQAYLLEYLGMWYEELREILPKLPENLKLYFVAQDYTMIMEEFGTGGFAYSPQILSLGYALDFPDKKQQLINLKSTLFHEGLHISQGYTSDQTFSLVECMVYEGLATVFERHHVSEGQTPYGEYPSKSVVQSWIEQMIVESEVSEQVDFNKWRFYDESDSQQWKLYKAGTWFIDNIISEGIADLAELTQMSATEILELKNGAEL